MFGVTLVTGGLSARPAGPATVTPRPAHDLAAGPVPGATVVAGSPGVIGAAATAVPASDPATATPAPTAHLSPRVPVLARLSRRDMTVNPCCPVVDLTALGALDWLHFGSLDTAELVEHAASGHGLPAMFTTIGGQPHLFTQSLVGFTWRDGTLVRSVENTRSELFVPGGGHGFRLTVALPARPTTLMLYLGSVASPAILRVTASDGEAAADTFPGDPAGGPRHTVYSIALNPAAGGGTVTITWTAPTDTTGGNVVLESVALLPR